MDLTKTKPIIKECYFGRFKATDIYTIDNKNHSIVCQMIIDKGSIINYITIKAVITNLDDMYSSGFIKKRFKVRTTDKTVTFISEISAKYNTENDLVNCNIMLVSIDKSIVILAIGCDKTKLKWAIDVNIDKCDFQMP